MMFFGYQQPTVMAVLIASCLLLLSFCTVHVSAFVSSFPLGFGRRSASSSIHHRSTTLFSGYGIATNYTWQEEAFEIDVTVQVPRETRAKDIFFKATSQSIDLRLLGEDERILLDASRKLRGRVSLDGTYWVISDADDDQDFRQVTVTIEKSIKTPKDDFELVDYDWKGVYSNDEEEVSERKYDEPEFLDVREYAAGLGVDIDNINMSMVDKTMFSSGLNLTQRSIDQLKDQGYAQEVTQQADGSEYITNDEGEAVPFDSLGAVALSDGSQQQQSRPPKPQIPFLDTNSPWHETVPVTVDHENNRTVVQQSRNFTRAAFAQDSTVDKEDEETDVDPKAATDPIDLLTVKRLKEILKSQGLKVSGNKKELQERLRSQVNSLLQGKQEP